MHIESATKRCLDLLYCLSPCSVLCDRRSVSASLHMCSGSHPFHLHQNWVRSPSSPSNHQSFAVLWLFALEHKCALVMFHFKNKLKPFIT